MMTDGTDSMKRRRPVPDIGAPVETLASRALDLLASKRQCAASLLSERFVEALSEAVLSRDPTRRAAVVEDMLQGRIRREEIADFYIPEVARRLGAAWCEDGLSFADVTIGSARLQGLLREIGRDWGVDAARDPMAPGVLLVVMADEFHTLGALVAASQLARLGVSVKLLVGRSEAEVLQTVAFGQFDAILLSAAQGEKLEVLRDMIESIRIAAVRPIPVVIGGSLLSRTDDAKAGTGADHATTDLREALRACGLRTSAPGARPRATSE